MLAASAAHAATDAAGPAAAPTSEAVPPTASGARAPDAVRYRASIDAPPALVPAILEQKETGTEAQQGFRRLVRRFGRRAPGPHADLWLPPAASELALVPSWAWLKLGVDAARSGTLLRAASVAPALERTLEVPLADADRRLRSVPGIGVWTSAEVRARAHGDPDAVSFGDAHVGHDIGWALTGNRVDDDGLLELLEPYRGHRLRVQLLVAAMGVHAPRRGPRLAPRTHLPR